MWVREWHTTFCKETLSRLFSTGSLLLVAGRGRNTTTGSLQVVRAVVVLVRSLQVLSVRVSGVKELSPFRLVLPVAVTVRVWTVAGEAGLVVMVQVVLVALVQQHRFSVRVKLSPVVVVVHLTQRTRVMVAAVRVAIAGS